jgi:hypothetical protein
MIHRETRYRRSRVVGTVACTGVILAVIAALLYHVVLGSLLTDIALAIGGDPTSTTEAVTVGPPSEGETTLPKPTDAFIDDLGQSINKATSRSYEIKMMARELIGYIRIMVAVLVVIAVGFPLTIWLMSRRRLIGLSGLSGEVTATLVLVEERQAKLANILKDIQNEIDYLHTMSVPDLKNLIQQAETYLKQNEKDLELVGPGKRASR